MVATVFGGLVGGLCEANSEVGRHPRGSCAQVSATLSLSFFQLYVLVWWAVYLVSLVMVVFFR